MEVHGESSQGKFLKEISLSDCGGSQGGYATKFQCAEEFSDVALESPRKYKKSFPFNKKSFQPIFRVYITSTNNRL